MTLSDLAALGGAVGGIAVLVTLGSLASDPIDREQIFPHWAPQAKIP